MKDALIRFRPIMMTTMAALMGTLPIAIGFGAEPRLESLGIGSCRRVNCLSTADALFYAGLYIYLDALQAKVEKAWGTD